MLRHPQTDKKERRKAVLELQDILGREEFQYLTVLNPGVDCSRTVSTVESTETPDVARYIPPNTLLLLTGMAFKDQPERLCQLLEDLSQRSCAAVAIKLGRFIHKLDDQVLRKANELGIPLLRIPMEKTLGEVYQEVLSFIWNSQNAVMVRALNAQQKVSNLILQGASVKSIVQNISMILKRPVMILDLFGNVVEYSYLYNRPDREQTVQRMRQWMEEDPSLDQASFSCYHQDGVSFCVYPIKGVGRNTNYMVVWDFEPGGATEHLLLLDQVILVLELYFYRDLYVKYNEMQQAEEYLRFLLEQLERRCWNERQVLTLGEFYGLKRAGEYRIILLDIGQGEQRKFNTVNFSKKEEQYILIYDWVRHLLQDENDILIFPQQSKWRYVCLIQGSSSAYLERLEEIYHMILQKFGYPMVAAQGGAVSSPLNLVSSVVEAERCMADGIPDKGHPFLLTYRPKNMMELFRFIPEREIRGICELTLKELAYPGNQMEEELRKTLYTYLFCNSSITKTAETMFLHRNTIKYRIKKCEEILNIDLSDMSSCFQIQLALMLTEHAQ